jgi:MYXO-CTERM domain-containing protein
VVPTNFRHVTINPLRIDWFRLGDNYDMLVSKALDQEGADGRAFVTEYAGSSEVVPWSGLRGFSWSSEGFLEATAATLSQTLQAQGLFGCGLNLDAGPDEPACGPTHPLLLGLLRTYFPPPSEVTETDFYACTECFGVDQRMWDPAGFAAAFEEQVVGPAEHAVDVLGANPYLTRLYTMISPGEMTIDPLFHERADLPEVSNQWAATQVTVCKDDEHDRLDHADGPSIRLDDIGGLPIFTGMSPAARIEEIPLTGAPVVLLDTTEESMAQLATWNESQSPSGCQCRTSGHHSQGAGWLGLLLLLGLRARAPIGRARPRQRIANS